MPDPADPYNLRRFVDAQQPVYMQVLAELRRGSKQGHWIWFIFPQLAGLGHSAMSRLYAIASLQEAEAYMRHPLLGPHLRECTELVNQLQDRFIEDILGPIDALKFRSCVTLFQRAAPDEAAFLQSLQQFFAGEPDTLTWKLLNPA